MKKSQYIILTVEFSKDKDNNWVAVCEELGTSTFASSFEEVKNEIMELVELHLTTLSTAGELERFFKENKIKMYSQQNAPTNITIDSPVNENTFINTFAKELQYA